MDTILRQIIESLFWGERTDYHRRQRLTLQQTRGIDRHDQLKTKFPSYTDLE